MNKQDNFEDNLYLIQIRIRIIQDTLILNTDNELFFEITLEDINFIDKTLAVLFLKLQGTRQRVDRDGNLDHLSEMERQFSKTLSDFMDNSGSISAREIPELKERISILRKASLERQESLETMKNALEGYQEEPVISKDEFRELLKDF